MDSRNTHGIGWEKLEMDPEHELIAVIYKTKAKHQRNQKGGQTIETTTHNTRLGANKNKPRDTMLIDKRDSAVNSYPDNN